MKATHDPAAPLRVQIVEFDRCRESLYDIRYRVFVVEQGVPESIEHDETDPFCRHVLAHWEGKPVGTGRLTPEGRIGRMAVLPEFRRHSVGSAMLEALLGEAREQGFPEVMLAAQLSAVTFYERFGFEAQGAVFTEAGIDHLMMRRRFDSPDPRSADTPDSTHP